MKINGKKTCEYYYEVQKKRKFIRRVVNDKRNKNYYNKNYDSQLRNLFIRYQPYEMYDIVENMEVTIQRRKRDYQCEEPMFISSSDVLLINNDNTSDELMDIQYTSEELMDNGNLNTSEEKMEVDFTFTEQMDVDYNGEDKMNEQETYQKTEATTIITTEHLKPKDAIIDDIISSKLRKLQTSSLDLVALSIESLNLCKLNMEKEEESSSEDDSESSSDDELVEVLSTVIKYTELDLE